MPSVVTSRSKERKVTKSREKKKLRDYVAKVTKKACKSEAILGNSFNR